MCIRKMYNNNVYNINNDNSAWKYEYDNFKSINIIILRDINIIILMKIFKTINKKIIIAIF